ncbi:hypothetical protein [Mediterraneibacter gnavus]|uniref:hypothetical protein n=1 Tax=Mediterraneibacter gnavus TaxID=33038 RepID=UPI003562B359
MYRKKLMRACLTGLMVVNVATANVAPVFAAEAPAGTETTTSKASVVKAQFVDAAGTVVAGGDYFVDADGDGIFNVSELPVPEGYKAETVGDFFTKDYADTALQVTVDKIAKASIINVQFMDGNKVVAGGDYFVDADGDGIFNLSELPVPEGYELSLAGDQFVKPNKEDDKKEDKKDEKKNSPKTGDETNAAAAALPAGVSLAAILAVLVKKFK